MRCSGVECHNFVFFPNITNNHLGMQKRSMSGFAITHLPKMFLPQTYFKMLD